MSPLLPSSPETFDHILQLRVVRRYLPVPIPPGEVEAILEAGRWTGSAKNRQSWAFVVVEDRKTLDLLAQAGDYTDPVLEAPLGIALVRLPEGNDFDLGRAAQNMMQAAAALGIGSCPITLHRREQAALILDLPDEVHCRWLLAFGYPNEAAEPEQRLQARARGLRGRKPLSEVVHWDRFRRER
jgi:nitroreductase